MFGDSETFCHLADKVVSVQSAQINSSFAYYQNNQGHKHEQKKKVAHEASGWIKCFFSFSIQTENMDHIGWKSPQVPKTTL